MNKVGRDAEELIYAYAENCPLTRILYGRTHQHCLPLRL